jgi:hypothetical protein
MQAIADMGAKVKGEIALPQELGIEVPHPPQLPRVAVIDDQRAENASALK